MSRPEGEPTAVGPDGRPLAEQPAWRQDFPIDVAQDQYVARRDFTKFLVLTSLAFAVGQAWIVFKSWWRRQRPAPPAVPIAKVDELRVGEARVFHYPNEEEPCLLLRLGPGKDGLVAYSQKCTHLACAVVPEAGTGRLHCPCHHGYFEAATGRPLAGPPRRPLPLIRLEVGDDGVVYAKGVERRTV
jgi:Rieske Fe-S protein